MNLNIIKDLVKNRISTKCILIKKDFDKAHSFSIPFLSNHTIPVFIFFHRFLNSCYHIGIK